MSESSAEHRAHLREQEMQRKGLARCTECGVWGSDVVPAVKDEDWDGISVMKDWGDLCTECMEEAGAEPEADYAAQPEGEFFVDLLVVEKEYSSGHRTIHPIKVGERSLSVQASCGHYCAPRELVPLTHYYLWECAVWDRDKWLSPTNAPEVFDGLACASNWEAGTCPVGGYIPTKDVQALYERLVALAGAEA